MPECSGLFSSLTFLCNINQAINTFTKQSKGNTCYFCCRKKRLMKKLNYLTLLVAMTIVAPAFSQEQKPEEDLYTLSLEELMNVPINSASKKDETLFDAPLSSYTITRSDIDKAGSTSIMEALKLAPGVIVREQANGMYDIHIRGMENLARTNEGTFLK